MQAATKKVKYCNLFKVVHADQIQEPLTDWIREAFAFAPELGRIVVPSILVALMNMDRASP